MMSGVEKNRGRRVMLTGGNGFIGSHCAVELLQQAYEVVICDNLNNSNVEVQDAIEKITGRRATFVLCDMCNEGQVFLAFEKYGPFDAVIHFAGLKAVGESVQKPIDYYSNNVGSTMTLLKAMEKYDCRRLVFSSSATVYGAAPVPMNESIPVSAHNPYARTKMFIEQILEDVTNSHSGEQWQIVNLRYFNPCGAHESGLMGENPRGIPNNLVPYCQRVMSGELPHLNVFGNDYDTHDGTGVRDYIHVVDLAEGHVAAVGAVLEANGAKLSKRFETFNLGSGGGHSVLDVVNSLRKASGREIKVEFKERRKGDIAASYADATKAKEVLRWQTKRSLDDISRDVVNFLTKCGYL